MRFSVLFLSSTLFFIFSARGQSPQWSVLFGGSEQDVAEAFQEIPDGGYIVAGEAYSSDGDVSNNNGDSDVWILELDDSGGLNWKNCYGGSSGEISRDLVRTSDGEYLLIGDSWSSDGDVSGTNNGGADVWVLKIDSSGTLLFEENFGGSKNDRGNAIENTLDGGSIVCGSSLSSDGDLSGNKGNKDLWLLKLDSTGSLEWERNYGGSDDDIGYAIEQGPAGNFFLAGNTLSSDGNVSEQNGKGDVWVLKIDTAGDIVWEKSFGGSEYDIARSMERVSDNRYILAGSSRSSDGDVSSNHGGLDFWVLTIDSSGSLIWEDHYGGSYADEGYSISKTSDGGFLVGGETGSDDVDVSGNNGSFDGWVLQLDSAGQLEKEANYGGSGGDVIKSIKRNDQGQYVGTGNSWSSNGDFSGNNGVRDYWIFSGNDPLSVRGSEVDQRHLQLSPNPTNGKLTLRFEAIKSEVHVQLRTHRGRLVQSKRVKEVRELPLNIEGEPGGYFVQVQTGDGNRYTRWVVKE